MKDDRTEKDPAVLFYTSDFLTGTSFFNDEQRGQYIRLLCEQHQIGHIPDSHMLNICKSYDSPVFSKFIKDPEGKWYNVRMESEIEKRRSYCESRRKNKMHDKHMSGHMTRHMSGHMENENENINIKEDKRIVKERRGFVKPTIEQVKAYCTERNNSVNPEKWMNHYEANGWMVGKNKMSDWKASVRTWENSTINDGTPKKIAAPKRVVTKKCWKCERIFTTDNESQNFCPECFKVVRAEQETKMKEIVRKAGK